MATEIVRISFVEVVFCRLFSIEATSHQEGEGVFVITTSGFRDHGKFLQVSPGGKFAKSKEQKGYAFSQLTLNNSEWVLLATFLSGIDPFDAECTEYDIQQHFLAIQRKDFELIHVNFHYLAMAERKHQIHYQRHHEYEKLERQNLVLDAQIEDPLQRLEHLVNMFKSDKHNIRNFLLSIFSPSVTVVNFPQDQHLRLGLCELIHLLFPTSLRPYLSFITLMIEPKKVNQNAFHIKFIDISDADEVNRGTTLVWSEFKHQGTSRINKVKNEYAQRFADGIVDSLYRWSEADKEAIFNVNSSDFHFDGNWDQCASHIFSIWLEKCDLHFIRDRLASDEATLTDEEWLALIDRKNVPSNNWVEMAQVLFRHTIFVSNDRDVTTNERDRQRFVYMLSQLEDDQYELVLNVYSQVIPAKLLSSQHEDQLLLSCWCFLNWAQEGLCQPIIYRLLNLAMNGLQRFVTTEIDDEHLAEWLKNLDEYRIYDEKAWEKVKLLEDKGYAYSIYSQLATFCLRNAKGKRSAAVAAIITLTNIHYSVGWSEHIRSLDKSAIDRLTGWLPHLSQLLMGIAQLEVGRDGQVVLSLEAIEEELKPGGDQYEQALINLLDKVDTKSLSIATSKNLIWLQDKTSKDILTPELELFYKRLLEQYLIDEGFLSDTEPESLVFLIQLTDRFEKDIHFSHLIQKWLEGYEKRIASDDLTQPKAKELHMELIAHLKQFWQVSDSVQQVLSNANTLAPLLRLWVQMALKADAHDEFVNAWGEIVGEADLVWLNMLPGELSDVERQSLLYTSLGKYYLSTHRPAGTAILEKKTSVIVQNFLEKQLNGKGVGDSNKRWENVLPKVPVLQWINQHTQELFSRWQGDNNDWGLHLLVFAVQNSDWNTVSNWVTQLLEQLEPGAAGDIALQRLIDAVPDDAQLSLTRNFLSKLSKPSA